MNWPTDTKQPLDLLIDTERVADQVLQNKQEIVELDKRRQHNREAKRLLEKSNEKKSWVTVGPLLVKMTTEKGIALLEKGMNSELVWSRANSQLKFNPIQIRRRSTSKSINCVANRRCWWPNSEI